MLSKRRSVAWLLALGLVFYGLAPVLAARPASAAAAAVACAASPVHTCACQPDPHRKSACCCDKDGPRGLCSMGRLPCEGDPTATTPLWTLAHPLQLPGRSSLHHRPARGAIAGGRLSRAPRAMAYSPLVPPPRS